MAERRMFAKTIIDSDAFLDMPLSTQALYFHLAMRADDDGFINNPKRIQRTIAALDDDLKLLIAKNFIIPFDTGVVVIKHWRIHNYIQSDRYKATAYQEEKSMLHLKPNNAYTLTDTQCIQDVSEADTQIRIDKDSKGKDSKGKDKFTPPTLEEVEVYCKERNSPVDPRQFWEYFNTGNWKDSKGNPVKNWKQKLLTWERFDKDKMPSVSYPSEPARSAEEDDKAMQALLNKLKG